MTDPFANAKLKLDRARHHAKSLQIQARRFGKSKPYRIRYEFQTNRTECRFYVTIKKPVPETWGLLVGDCVHNARAALDHLIWGLSENFSGPDPTDTETMFPITNAPSWFDKYAGRRIERLPLYARTLVEHTQPYHGPDPMRHPLWVCRDLDDIDKHKIIPVITAAVQSPGVSPTTSRLKIIETKFKEGPFVDGAEIGLLRFANPAPAKVKMHTYFAIVETLSEHPPYLDCWRTLQRLVYYVGRTIDIFGEFPAHHEWLAILQAASL